MSKIGRCPDEGAWDETYLYCPTRSDCVECEKYNMRNLV